MNAVVKRGIYLLFSIYFLVTFYVQAAPPIHNKSLGNMVRHTWNGNVLTGITDQGNFRISIYSANIIRLQISQDTTFGNFSYAVINGPVNTNVTFSDKGDHLLLSTDSIELYISQKPVRFRMVNKQGRVINEDDAAFGTSWLGEEVTTYKKLQEGERFIGLGEKTGNLDRRGQAYTNWNTDYFAYPVNADAIYMTTPFYIGIHHGLQYGIFMDNSSKSHFNFGASNNRFSSFTAEEGEMNYYFIYHTHVAGIIESYTSLTGRMKLPPLWSLGLQQSRYSYYPDSEVLRVAQTFRDKKIPADVIYLDIHYMDAYKIFTWDKKRFPDPKRMTDALKAKGFHTAVILDPGIKVEKGYAPYDDGIAQDVFVKYPDQSYYTGEVWPGWCHFPDFTNPRVRNWWAGAFHGYVQDGIEGFWNDMNEFATWGQSTPNLLEFDFDGHKATHRTARNVYGLNMTRSTFEGTQKLLNGKRPFLLTRSGYAGIQRYSAVWTGDNVASDEHMMTGVRLVNSMGISGIPVTGMDVGGFTGDGSKELFARWITIGAFSPFFRVHAKENSRSQEPWSSGELVEATARNFVNLRYRLIPYIYVAFYEAATTGIPVSRSLAITNTHDALTYDTRYQNQFFFGPSILVAPGESTRDYYKVYLPDGDWYDFYNDKYFATREEIVSEASTNHLPLFIKGGSIVPMQSVVQNLSEQPADTLYLHVYFGKNNNTFTYYEDDGSTYSFEKGEYLKRTISYQAGSRTLTLGKAEGSYTSKFRKVKVYLHGFSALPKGIRIDKKPEIIRKEVYKTELQTIPVQTFVLDHNAHQQIVSW
ncbi:MAG TPA: glycoside hydrolase family 31 protein [Ohtaekwangia sp.]|uniref:glycoside hydrolase family 31 protein n=1 Tax=Ohtaekwangia sp. TaxID=2066019 RepID=UPI002F93404F